MCLTPHTSEMFHFLYITVIWRYHQSRSFNYYTQRALVFHMYQTALHFSYNAHVIQCRSRSLSFNNQVALTWFGIIFEAVRRGHLTFCLLWVMFFLIVHPLKKSWGGEAHQNSIYKTLQFRTVFCPCNCFTNYTHQSGGFFNLFTCHKQYDRCETGLNENF